MSNPKCQKCYCYFKPTLKTSGELYKNCDRCREIMRNNTNQNNKCIKCKIKHPIFGLSTDKKATFCKDCKNDDMIDIIHQKCIKCKIKHPIFGLPTDTKATLCGDCKNDDMINIISPKCITPLCDKYSNIDKYCIRCFYALNPNDKRCKRIKFKENEIIKYIQETFKDLNWICDNSLIGDNMCLKYRPDVLLHLNNHSIIIECDEKQHRHYKDNNTCENSREHQIQEALNRPVVFIRFNPDEYLDLNNKKVMSCFIVDKKLGFNTIPKNQESRWITRLETLKNTVLKSVEKPPINPIEKIYLYYDGYK